MGIDYSASTAIIVDINGMLKIINGKNKKAVLEVIQSFVDKMVDYEYTSDKTKKWLKKLDNIPSNITLANLKEKLSDFHEVSGSAGKYDGDCRLSLIHI